MCFPVSTSEVKGWISSALGSEETRSVAIIHRIVEEHDIDGKLLLLLHKFPNELQAILPNFRARLLLLSALDNLIISSSVRLASLGRAEPAGATTEPRMKEEEEEEATINSTQDGSQAVASETSAAAPLPVLDEDLLRAVGAGRLRERTVRDRLVAACARHYVQLKSCLTRKDYDSICRGLLRRYPDLRDGPGETPIATLRRLLSVAVGNLRRRKGVRRIATAIRNRYRDMAAARTAVRPADSAAAVSSTTCAVPSVIPSPPPLPPLDARLRRAVNEGRLKERAWRVRFIGRCAEYYASLKPYPNRNDYYNISFHLANRFPDLGGPEDVKYALSMHIRNRRRMRKAHDGSSTAESPPRMERVTSRVRERGSPIVEPVPLPPLDRALRRSIDEGQLNDRSVKNRFVRICAEFYMSLKRYPSKEDYNNICRKLVSAFPELRDSAQVPGLPPFMTLKKALTACIRNKRRECMAARNPSPDFPDGSDEPPMATVWEETRVKVEPAEEDLTRAETTTAVDRDASAGDIPVPAPVPTLGEDILDSMRGGAAIAGKAKSKFLHRCTEFYLRMKYYPSSEDYNNICESLVRAFPQLADLGSFPDRWSYGSLKKDLSMYFRNFRHRNKMDRMRDDPKNVAGSNFDEDGLGDGGNRGTGGEGEPIPYPCPLPALPRGLEAALGDGGLPLEGRVRSRLLQAWAEFFVDLKYYPSKLDYGNICRTLMDAYPKLCGSPGNVSQESARRLRKDFSMHVRSVRHREKRDKNGTRGSRAPGGNGPTGSPGCDMSVFDSFFHAAPTQEDVERNIQQLKSLISELK